MDRLCFELIVYQTEDGYDEDVKVHKNKTSAMSGAIWVSTERVGRSSLLLNSSRKPAHGVSYVTSRYLL